MKNGVEGIPIKKAYLKKMFEQRYSVTLPILLSIIASLIYSLVFTNYLNVFLEQFRNIGEQLSEQGLSYKDLFAYIADYSPELFISFPLLAIIVIFLLIWLIAQGINIIGYFVGGPNTNRTIAEQYEFDNIDKLITCNEYFEITKRLQECAEDFFQVVAQLEDIDTDDSSIMSFLENGVEEKYFNGSNTIFDEQMLKIWDKELLIKSIICRSFLIFREKHKKLYEIINLINLWV